MSKMEVLLDAYSLFLGARPPKNAECLLFEFKHIIQRFTRRNQQSSHKYRFLSTHVHFLLQAVCTPSQPSAPHFSTALQILNHLLRSTLLQDFRIPFNLLQSLARQLQQNQVCKHSAVVVGNVIWLVCRCLQVCRDRELFMRSLSGSGLLEQCLQSKQMDLVTQRGLLLLLNYLCKRQLDRKQIYLTVLRNADNFSQAEMWVQMFALLRKDRALQAISKDQQLQRQLRRVVRLYLNHCEVAQTFLLENQRLIILAANFEEQDLASLQIERILQLYLTYPTVDLQNNYLNKIFDIFAKICENEEKIDKYLNLSLQTLSSNKVSRRIFVLYHERVSYKQFVDILKGEYTKRLSTRFLSAEEGNNRVKFLICMKRISKRLKIESFYSYKLKPLVEKHLSQEGNIQLNEQLVQLLRDVTSREQKSQLD